MSTETLPIVVTEFLRPENSHEPVVYHVTPHIAEKVERLNEQGLTVCCDIYPSGKCRVYVYDPIHEASVATSVSKQHTLADILLQLLIEDFDLASVS